MTASIERGKTCPAGAIEHGKIRVPCMIRGVRAVKGGPFLGKIFARCILQRRFAGHFEYMESISCQNQLILDAWRANLATKRRFYRPKLLWGYIRVIFC